MSFPLPVLPCRGDQHRLPSHCLTQPRPILHFLWSILESVQEEKHMHASSTHTRKHTTQSPSFLCLHLQSHTDTQEKVKEQEK